MKTLKKLGKWCAYILALPILYILLSLALTAITVNSETTAVDKNHTIFLNTNGVHLDIVLSLADIHPDLLKGLVHSSTDQYLSFGWGDENFYLNTPTWADLTFPNALRAAFFKSPTLMHVTRYRYLQNHWVKVTLSKSELNLLNSHIEKAFKRDAQGRKILLKDEGYTPTDEFYRANGSYSCIKTCNSWANSVFKESGLKACLWTPFDFGLLNKYTGP